METHPSYDLNAAVENWRVELTSQADLTGDDRRELEVHLWEAIAELRERGLNEEESFLLARHRLGPTHEIADEFIKVNPGKVWRERIIWALIFMLIFQLWTSTTTTFVFWFDVTMKFRSLIWLKMLMTFFLPYAPLIYFAYWVSKNGPLVSSVFQQRSRFVYAAIAVTAARVLECAACLNMRHQLGPSSHLRLQFFSTLSYYLIVLGLIAWLHRDAGRKAYA